jgi:limonene-1,2-epoxide hydrolase
VRPAAKGRRIAAGLLFTLVLAGCGSSEPSAESVLRAWSQELNSGDNEAAAKLFAKNARVVQPGSVFRLRTYEQALAWNAALPCSGKIVRVTSKGNIASATFVLGDRQASKCDGPGQRATALIRVRKGKIVLWHQTSGGDATIVPAI